MATSVTNMKELCEYAKQKRRSRKLQHLEIIKIYGECKGMGNKRYKLPQKSSFPQQHKHTCNKMWRGNNEKYVLKTLKLQSYKLNTITK